MTRIIGLAGWSGAGKTTLIAKLIPLLRQRGLSVSTVKHAHHAFDIDQPGKDSFVHREAGAQEVLVASSRRWALMHELRDAAEPSLHELLSHLSAVDLIIIEGFKRDPHPKIEVHRTVTGKPFLFPEDSFIRAVATDAKDSLPLPCVSLDDTATIADLMMDLAMPLADLLHY